MPDKSLIKTSNQKSIGKSCSKDSSFLSRNNNLKLKGGNYARF